jgi:dolichol-phosphate mannosyltransferase
MLEPLGRPLQMSESLWICLPTYNERDNLPRMIDALAEEFARHELDGHVLVIDDNSPDGTGVLADELANDRPWMEVLHRPGKEGLGRAYLAGFAVALERGAGLIMEMDCDFSHSPQDVHRLVAAAKDSDLVLGSRNVPGGGVENWPWHRRFISRGGSWYARSILRVPVRDLTGGFKCFRRATLERINLNDVEAQGYTFQIDLTYRVLQAGMRVVEVPIVFVDRVYGESKMRGSIVFEAMWRVWQLRARRNSM